MNGKLGRKAIYVIARAHVERTMGRSVGRLGRPKRSL
jgi:hypothetical protein